MRSIEQITNKISKTETEYMFLFRGFIADLQNITKTYDEKWKDIAFKLDSLTERKRKLIQLKQTIDLLKWVIENE